MTTSGCSSITRWPASRTTAKSARGRAAAITSLCSCGIIRSWSPVRTRLSTSTSAASASRLSWLVNSGRKSETTSIRVEAIIRAVKSSSSWLTGDAYD